MKSLPIESRRYRVAKEADLSPGQFDLLLSLRRHARTIHLAAEEACNGYPRPVTEYRDGKTYRYNVEDPERRARWESRDERARREILSACMAQGWTVEFQDDPRGWPVSVKAGGYDLSDIVCGE